MGNQEQKMPESPDAWPPRMAVCVGAVILQGTRVLFIHQARCHALSGQWRIPRRLVDGGRIAFLSAR